MSRKTEVYTWRVASSTKADLEEAARNGNLSVARLLDEIVGDYLSSANRQSGTEIDRQRRLHARAARFSGCFGGVTRRRSERVRVLVRARLRRRLGRKR